MSPIPLHKNAPIAPIADGITPKTASDHDQNQNQAHPPPTRTIPASVPATTTTTVSSSSSNPPPPQPGARPIAPTSTPSTTNNNNDDPPAPQPGRGYTATHTTIETRLAGPPPQYTIPPPSHAQLAGRSTTTSTTPNAPFAPGPTSLNTHTGPALPAASPFQQEHSGGAVQPPQGRSSLEGPPGYQQAPDNTPYAPMVGSGVGAGGDRVGGGEGVGAAAWNMLAKAGDALKKGEEATWKAIRNNK
ncbi:hypothetical protein CC80DRAFT_239094 [Byssothecium circinans]|uniref:Uncharacterized protein n=1 Tax=Byssothecium circinans TaxID=147558 RepID=A0A6A5U8N4_9PLEO|nr:hypothetical protein CC80DRAFT_239094 [Byssothecium circinans]